MNGEAFGYVKGGFKLMRLLEISSMLEFALSNTSDAGTENLEM